MEERLHKVLGQIRSKLEHIKKMLWSHSAFIFDWIIFKLAGCEDRHKISDEFDNSLWSYMPLSVKIFFHLDYNGEMNISEASLLILIKFYIKDHWGGGKAAYGLGADWIQSMVSITTKSSHRLKVGRMLWTR